MLAEKYILKDTVVYKKLSISFSSFDNFFKLNPLRWFAVWTMVISGRNVAIHLENRWIYWDWNSFSLYVLFALLLSSFIDFIFNTKINKNVNQSIYVDQLKMFIYGFVLFFIGANPINISFDLLFFGLPYILFFLNGNFIWKISLEIFNSSKLQRKKLSFFLVPAIICTFFASLIGFINDDPMISTVSAVFLPFPIVAISFSPAIRHLQRCRMYVVFIPAMFLSMRYPWFLTIILPLFLFSRYYHYFTQGNVVPTLKVNESNRDIIK